MSTSALTGIALTRRDVFGPTDPQPDDLFLSFESPSSPITYFVGRNGTGKSRAATAIAQRTGGRHLSTDRLVGLMSFHNYGWTSVPNTREQRGVPLGAAERQQARQFAAQSGTAADELYALREQPEVWLRVAAFLRRALGRIVELREESGFLDPYIRVGDVQYSLIRDEGHGLRELVVLLTAVYRSDWTLLVVDEPELHLHPSLARLWRAELEVECASTGKHGLIVTHEPSLIRPRTAGDLGSLWLFSAAAAPQNVGATLVDAQRTRVDASLQLNPDLVSALVFSPRPVLVEGAHDVAALSVAIARTHPPEVVAQTDFVECGGTSGVALWFEVATKLHLDVRAVADLDGLFDRSVQRAADVMEGFEVRVREELKIEPANVANALRPLSGKDVARTGTGKSS